MPARRTPWQCVKCHRNHVESDEDPLNRLNATLDPAMKIGYCYKCKQRRMFVKEIGG